MLAESPAGTPLHENVKVIELIADDGPKCGGCNWDNRRFYALEGQNARPFTDDAEVDGENPCGMCADCFCSWLVEAGATVTINYEGG